VDCQGIAGLSFVSVSEAGDIVYRDRIVQIKGNESRRDRLLVHACEKHQHHYHQYVEERRWNTLDSA